MTGELLPKTDVATLRARAEGLDEMTLRTAAEIVDDVRRRGAAAVREHAVRLDGLAEDAELAIGRDALAAAFEELPVAIRELLTRTAARIEAFSVRQRECLGELSFEAGGLTMGHECIPVARAGCYAPGGRYPLPSSVLMTAIPARVAGVGEIVVTSPRPAPVTLAAAFVAGAGCVLPLGGAQAIAALAFGVAPAPRCDVIVGPGNRFVTAAKHLVSPHAGIDMLAGPSELVVLADAAADPRLVAADLIAQAEHDEDALPVLVTDAEDLLVAVRAELDRQLDGLATAAVARVALGRGGAVVCADQEDAFRACDALASEHLALHVRDAGVARERIHNAGAVFEGASCGEVFGDYGVGPNHVLPTGGQSRHQAGLSVFTFLRMRTFLRGEAEPGWISDVAALADLEGLAGHAAAARARG